MAETSGGTESVPIESSMRHAAGPEAPRTAGLGRGSFLVASRNLRDPNFRETVVLILEYGESGAMGLVINRPTELAPSRILPQIEGLQEFAGTVSIGGPVGISQMLFLVRSEAAPEESEEILEGMHLSGNAGLLERLSGAAIDEGELRIYAGHAGWAAGQLDFEISLGSWHVMPGSVDMVFDRRPEEIWHELIVRTTVRWALCDPGMLREDPSRAARPRGAV